MSIRTATEADVSQIARLVSSLAHYYLDGPTHELPQWFALTLTESAFSARISNSAFLNLVFEDFEGISGYLSLKDGSHLYHLFVAATAQRKGIAGCLWKAAKERSDSRIYTLRSSIFAVPFYRHFGFVESEPAGDKDGIAFQPMELRE
jgi:GNAT superfamily N-acetyltransferase